MKAETVKLSTILTESKIISANPDANKRIKVRLKVLGVEKRGLEKEVEGATKQYIRKAGQFIYGKQNFHKGAFGIVPPELDGFESSSDLPAFDVSEKCLPEFLFYFFKQGNFYLELSKIASGVATQRINTESLFQIDITLPRIKDQKSLIKRIKSLENNGAQIYSELNRQLYLLKKLRQQLLQDAIRGKLVPQNKKDESASELLKRIKAEKQKLLAEKKIKKEKDLPPIKPEEIPFEIPVGWVWCRLGEICTKIGSGSTPSGSNYSKEGIPFFRSQNVYETGLVYEDITFIDQTTHHQMSGTTVVANDLLLNITGGSIGRCSLVPTDFHEGNVSQHVCIIRPLIINNEFIFRLILSPFFQNFILKSTTGAGRQGLPKYNLEQFVIPIPPLNEQKKISEKINQLLLQCTEIEKNTLKNICQNENLLQQVLREALRK